MEDDNIITSDVQDTGAQEALPVTDNDTQVNDTQTTAEPSDTQQDVTDTQDAPTVDEELKKYAESNGIELDSPGAIKAAQLARKSQSEATRNYQKSQELEKATNITQEQLPADATPQQHENVRIRNLELQIGISNWKQSNPEKLALEKEMIGVLSDHNKKYLVQEGYLSLDDVYSIAKANSPDNSAEIKSQGKQEALKSLAQKQQAAVPTGNATTQGLGSQQKPFGELSISQMESKLGFARQ
jgi:hypothetical protein